MPTTLDFHIRPKAGKTFHLGIFERGSSQPSAETTFDYDLSYMTEFEISRLESARKDPYERMERLRAFGGKLYQQVFTPEIEKIWQQHKKKSDFLCLCLRFAPEADGLEMLPWETLYDGEEFLAAGVTTGLTRLPLDINLQNDLPDLPLPLKMLALMSSPLDLAENERLQIEQEQELLLRATNAPTGQGRLHIEFEDEAKLPVIESSLESGYQIFHYSGHGINPQSGGGLLLEDSAGKKRPTAVNEFLQTLGKGEKQIRLAVLSGCQTARTMFSAGFQDLARQLTRRNMPAVIAMQFSITDDAGLLFAETLYPRLIEGQPLDVAVSASRRALLLSDEFQIQADAFAPVLFLSCPQPLKTKLETTGQPATATGIEFNVYLPLAQLSFGFYGRRKDYRAIRDGLLYKNHRAIIVHGIGGIGKTALISHAATRLKAHFNGVYAFDCRAGTLAPEMILLELHRFLERLKITALQPLMHQSIPPEQLGVFMGQVLSQIPLLIIFDNFETQLVHNNGEHEIADETLRCFLQNLVKTTSRSSRFMFTCRYLFDLDENRIGPIQTLALGDLSRPEALGLMQNLPHLANASFSDKLDTYGTFGGHPYTLVVLDRHCSQKSLGDALKDAKNVHAELREFLAIDLNYEKLSPRSRELLNRLAAFRKPVGLDAVHWVLGERIELQPDFLKKFDRSQMPEEMQKMSDIELLKLFQQYSPEQRRAEGVDEQVAELINWGLLTPLEEDGEIRAFSVHSLVREFCCDRLDEPDWQDLLRNAASYYTNSSKMSTLDKASTSAVFEKIEASELLFEAGDYEKTANIIIEIDPYLDRWGLGRTLESLYKQVLPKVKRETYAIIIHNLAILYQARGEYGEALKGYQKSLKIKEEIGDRARVARSLHQIGMIHQARGEYGEALKGYQNSLKIKEEIGDRAGVARSLHQIGRIHQARGEYGEALKQYQNSLKIAEEIGDRAGVARSLHQIGIIHQERGEYGEALKGYQKSLKIKEEIGDRAGVAKSLHQIGRIHQERGEYGEALKGYQNSLKIKEEIGDRAGVAISLHQIGRIHQERGEYGEALKGYQNSLKIAEEIGDRAGVAKSLHQIGMIHQARGEYGEALKQYQNSLKIKEEIGNRAGVAISLHQIGMIHQEHGDFEDAFEKVLAALLTFTQLQSPNANIAANTLKKLRKKWGAANFDPAWQEKTGEAVPEWLTKE
ncbi:tetratricopeptide repeat protein [candidate division KSB1 bacterium]|nr:tetratricopeptide repeat protein [candidate division KSB1 bacterium]